MPTNLYPEYQLIELLDSLENGSRPKGGVQKYSEGIPSLGGEHLNYNGKFNLDKLKFIPEVFADKLKKGRIANEDILIVKDGATTGKTCYVNDSFPFEKAFVNEHVFICRPHKQLSSKYIYYFLYSKEGQNRILENFTGSAQGGINQKFAKNTLIPLAPLAEQNRIVAKLDALFGHLEELKDKLDRIPELLKNFRQSVLTQAVTGKLTEEWREGNEINETANELKHRWLKEREDNFSSRQKELIEKGKIKRAKNYKLPVKPDLETSKPIFIPTEWELVSVSEFAECLDNLRKPVKKEDRESSKGLYPYFGANGEVDRVDNYIIDDDIVLVTEDETFYGRTKPIAYRFKGKCWVNNHVHVLKAPTQESNDFLCYTLMYYNVIPWLTGTTGRAKLTQGAMNSLPIGMPSLEEQQEIVKTIENLFSIADSIEAQYKSLKEKIDHLPQAILQKAFKGELVPQDPSDEPASVLLERVKGEKNVSTKK